MTRITPVFALWVLGIALLAAPAAAEDQATTPSSIPSIVTSGEASVRRIPDQAFVTLAVETRARSSRDAQRQNAESMTEVQQRIAGAGLAKDAVRTTGFTIQQEYDYANGRRTPKEYVARNGLEIRLDAVERTGEILDLVQAGATTISGVRFDVKDRAAAVREALRLAVEDARGRADALAAGAGRAVDRILRIDDSRQTPAPMMMRTAYLTAKSADESVTTPVEPGLIEIRAQVTLTVAIK